MEFGGQRRLVAGVEVIGSLLVVAPTLTKKVLKTIMSLLVKPAHGVKDSRPGQRCST